MIRLRPLWPQKRPPAPVTVKLARPSQVKKVANFVKGVVRPDTSGFITTGSNVEFHYDNTGEVFLYCSAGEGTLTVKDRGSITLKKGEFLIFNDYLLHSWDSVTKDCTLGCFELVSYKTSHLEQYPQFKGLLL